MQAIPVGHFCFFKTKMGRCATLAHQRLWIRITSLGTMEKCVSIPSFLNFFYNFINLYAYKYILLVKKRVFRLWKLQYIWFLSHFLKMLLHDSGGDRDRMQERIVQERIAHGFSFQIWLYKKLFLKNISKTLS